MDVHTSNFVASEDGWTCNGVTTCGNSGSICGGYNKRWANHSIQKTITLSPNRMYGGRMDFIKVKSWGGECAYVYTNGVLKWSQ